MHVWHPVDPGSSLGGVTTLCEGPPGRLTPVWGALDGRSTCGCARNTCVREAQGCASRSGGQCDDVPSLQMSMCSDCHAINPDSLALRSECMLGIL